MKLLPPSGPERRRTLARLVLALAALAVVVWYQRQPTTPTVPTSNLPTGMTAPTPLALPEAVRLGDLDAAPAPVAIRRNPFDFGAAAPAAPSAPRAGGAPGLATLPPAAVPPPSGPPPIALRLTGMLVSPGTSRTLVTLRDPATGALFHGFEGDVVDGRYRIVKVGNASVVVSYVDGTGPRTLGLGQ